MTADMVGHKLPDGFGNHVNYGDLPCMSKLMEPVPLMFTVAFGCLSVIQRLWCFSQHCGTAIRPVFVITSSTGCRTAWTPSPFLQGLLQQ